MVKSHRSSSTFFHKWPTASTPPASTHPALPASAASIASAAPSTPSAQTASKATTIATATPSRRTASYHDSRHKPLHDTFGTPGSPFSLDPFGSQVTHPEPVRTIRPRISCVSTSTSSSACSNANASADVRRVSTTQLVHGSATTPGIVLASPSTSTIHYLFPTAESQSTFKLSSSNTVSSSGTWISSTSGSHSRRTVRMARSGGVSTRQSSDQADKEQSGHRKALDGSFSHVPTRREPVVTDNRSASVSGPGAASLSLSGGQPRAPLGTARRVPSVTLPKPEADADQDMRTLRRQPSMANLAKAKGMKMVEASTDLNPTGKIERAPLATMKMEETVTRAPLSFSPPAPETGRGMRHSRRRSQSLSSPSGLASGPSTADPSPTIPAPDFGDPISFADVIASPSYSNLDYSTAGSTPTFTVSSYRHSLRGSNVFRRSGASGAIYPLSAAASASLSAVASASASQSVAMSRGETRAGLGSYAAGKERAREDAARRLNGDLRGDTTLRRGGDDYGDANSAGGRVAELRRSVSFKRESIKAKARQRTHSLSGRSIKELGISPPMPIAPSSPASTSSPSQSWSREGREATLSRTSSHEARGLQRQRGRHESTYEPSRGIHLGDPSVDLGGRYGVLSRANVGVDAHPESTANTTTTAATTTTTATTTATTATTTATTTPTSTSALGWAPLPEISIIGRPLHPTFALASSGLATATSSEISLSLSLLGPSCSSASVSRVSTPASLPSSLEAEAIDLTETGGQLSRLRTQSRLSTPRACMPIPPPGSVPAPKLAPGRSSGAALEQAGPPGPSEREGSPKPEGLAEDQDSNKHAASRPRRSLLLAQNTFYIPPIHPKPCLRSSKSSVSLRRSHPPSASPAPNPSVSACPYPTTPEAPPRLRRTLTALPLSLCSPPDVIDPLPVPIRHPQQPREPTSCPPAGARTNTNTSPFLSASHSLRVAFGRGGFVARSLSSAFEVEREGHRADSGLKERISGPLEAGWREGLLREAVSLSVSSRLHKFAGSAGDEERECTGGGIGEASRTAKGRRRSAIPDILVGGGEGHEARTATTATGGDHLCATNSDERCSPSMFTKRSSRFAKAIGKTDQPDRAMTTVPAGPTIDTSAAAAALSGTAGQPRSRAAMSRSRSVFSLFRRDRDPSASGQTTSNSQSYKYARGALAPISSRDFPPREEAVSMLDELAALEDRGPVDAETRRAERDLRIAGWRVGVEPGEYGPEREEGTAAGDAGDAGGAKDAGEAEAGTVTVKGRESLEKTAEREPGMFTEMIPERGMMVPERGMKVPERGSERETGRETERRTARETERESGKGPDKRIGREAGQESLQERIRGFMHEERGRMRGIAGGDRGGLRAM